MIPVWNTFEGLFCAESFTCYCLSCYLLSHWDEYQVSHLTRLLEVNFSWNAASPLTGSGVNILDLLLANGFPSEVLCSCHTCAHLQRCIRSRMFPCDFKSFWICHRRIVSSVLWQRLKARLLFSVFISFLYEIDCTFKVFNFIRYGFVLSYSVVLLGTGKLTGQKGKTAFLTSFMLYKQIWD